MTETTNEVTPETGEHVDGIDDVEAHGLREVAAAAGIGAAVIGAGGAALAASGGTMPTPGPKMPAIVQQATDDTRHLANDITQGAGGFTATARSDAQQLTGHTTAAAHEIADPALNDVRGIAADATDLATDTTDLATSTAGHAASFATGTASAAIRTVDRTATGVESAATRLAGSAEHTATTAAGKAVHDATTVAGNTVDKAAQRVDGVERSVLSVVGAVRDAVDQGWTLDFNVLGRTVGAGGNMLTPTGNVWVTDANGHKIASTRLGHGHATIKLSAIGQQRSITVHYGGDSVFGPTSLAYHLPTGL